MSDTHAHTHTETEHLLGLQEVQVHLEACVCETFLTLQHTSKNAISSVCRVSCSSFKGGTAPIKHPAATFKWIQIHFSSAPVIYFPKSTGAT